jgi:hypothetical protein
MIGRFLRQPLSRLAGCPAAILRPFGASRRTLAVKCKTPSSDPLHLLQQEAIARQLCDTQGNRLAGVDWRFSIAVTDREGSVGACMYAAHFLHGSDPRAVRKMCMAAALSRAPRLLTHFFFTRQAPNLRTVGIERITPSGIDFVVKRGSTVADALTRGQELSFLYTQGLFLPGQSAEQMRGEGLCLALALPEVIAEIPHFVITSMVGSKRIAREGRKGWPVDEQQAAAAILPFPETAIASHRNSPVENRSHLTEIMQQTRLELENGDVTLEELNECIRAFRLQPERIEGMWASPDSSVMWDRWEWLRDSAGDCPEGLMGWQPPRNLVPH